MKRITEVVKGYYSAPITGYRCVAYKLVFDDGSIHHYRVGCDPAGKKPAWMKKGVQVLTTSYPNNSQENTQYPTKEKRKS